MKTGRWVTVFAACVACAAAGISVWGQLAITDNPPATMAAAGLAWGTNLESALETARQADQPVVLIFGAPWCEWCRKLTGEIAKPEVQAKLGGVTRVYLDFDKNRELAKKYAVGPIPALRVLRGNGRVIAVQDGYMRAERLVTWLGEAEKAATEVKVEALMSDDVPTAATIQQIVGAFGDAEPEAREAAIRRLLPYPAQAGPVVVQSFVAGPLASQLTALDLLDAWKAPVEKLDPWRPETITKERLEALKGWAANPTSAMASATQPVLDERQLADARQLIDKLLAASDDETGAIRERLARYGPALLPTVYGLLKNPPGDQGDKVKDRLTLLRYRLAASDALAMQWPVGLERLASPQIKVRHSALDELGKRVTAKDAPLLLQLFSDPDALVRETALRLLQSVGGPGAMDALAQLLKDPDPNVRAAVLKSVEEQPSPTIANQIADYVSGETDPDLLVHAARVLRKARGDNPMKALYSLLGNGNWRVRAEAAEALTEAAGGRSNASNEVKAAFYVRMSDLLDDSDGFVASKAMLALEGGETAPDVKKVAAAAARHPELAPEAVKLLASSIRSNPASAKDATELIRAFATHKDPVVRAATVGELANSTGEAAAGNVRAAMKDTEASVRMAASDAIFAQLEEAYPKENEDYSERAVKTDKAAANEKFLADFASGKTRPEWLNAFAPELEGALAAKSPRERVKAALCLIALGHREKAMPALKGLVAETPGFIGAATAGLKWLPWDERLAFFNDMLPLASAEQLAYLGRGMCYGENPKAAECLWTLLANSKASLSLAGEITTELRRLIMGSEYRSTELPAADKKAAVEALNKVMEGGNELQRIACLALLPSVSPEAAADAATKLRADEKAPEALRRDAFQIQLSMLSSGDAQAQAALALDGGRPLEKKLAIAYLVEGGDAIRELRQTIYLSVNMSSEGYSSGQPIVPLAPHGVKAETLKPLLADKDEFTAAAAAYMLALLHDRSGMDALIAYYKAAPERQGVRRMVYRAITALDDDSYAPFLTDMYKDLAKDRWELREYYWTIRSMTGEKVMALRKQIRAEIGMENLR